MDDPGALSVILARMEMKLDESIRIGGDHETRLRALESNRWPLAALNGLVATGALVTSVLVAFTR